MFKARELNSLEPVDNPANCSKVFQIIQARKDRHGIAKSSDKMSESRATSHDNSKFKNRHTAAKAKMMTSRPSNPPQGTTVASAPSGTTLQAQSNYPSVHRINIHARASQQI